MFLCVNAGIKGLESEGKMPLFGPALDSLEDFLKKKREEVYRELLKEYIFKNDLLSVIVLKLGHMEELKYKRR